MNLSIVIPTRDRRALLEKTLDSLAGQVRELAGECEVVVVDHGSGDGTSSLVEAQARTLPVRLVPVPFRGESIADPKNAGARAAEGRILVFLDCGMICPPGFLTAHLALHPEDGAATCVAGAVVGWDSEDVGAGHWRALDLRLPRAGLPAEFTDPRADRWAGFGDLRWMLMWGANVSVPRASFLGVGGFDPQMRGWGWDDMELAYRLADAGVALDYSPEAWAVHYPHPRRPLPDRMRTAEANWRRSHLRHLAPEMEIWDRCDYWDSAECLRRLRATADGRRSPAPASDTGETRVLIGFAVPEKPAPGDTYVVSPAQQASASWQVRSFGIRSPFQDRQYDCAVVSQAFLDDLAWSPSAGWPTMADWALREAGRVASRVRIQA